MVRALVLPPESPSRLHSTEMESLLAGAHQIVRDSYMVTTPGPWFGRSPSHPALVVLAKSPGPLCRFEFNLLAVLAAP